MGTGRMGGGGAARSIRDNLAVLKELFKITNGYFGVKSPNNTKSWIRNIASKNPKSTAEDFYNIIARGSVEKPIHMKVNGKETEEVIGRRGRLADGTIISWRDVSRSDGTSVVEINIRCSNNAAGVKQQKIHFVKGEAPQ